MYQAFLISWLTWFCSFLFFHLLFIFFILFSYYSFITIHFFFRKLQPSFKITHYCDLFNSNCFIRREKFSFVVTSLNLIDQNKMKNSMLRLSKSLLVTAILSKFVYLKNILQAFHYLYLYHYFGNQPSFSSCFFSVFPVFVFSFIILCFLLLGSVFGKPCKFFKIS